MDLWSTPNPFRDCGSATVPHKELADLLVVFGDDILLFSDKEVRYNPNGKSPCEWNRWKRRAVDASLKQLIGAKKWLLKHPDRVFKDPGCNQRLDAAISSRKTAKIHLITVMNGYDRTFEVAGRPARTPFICGTPPQQDEPYRLSQIMPAGDFVRLWDRRSLPILLDYLTTALELIEYLTVREQLGRTIPDFMFMGEEEALALHLLDDEDTNRDNHPEWPRASPWITRSELPYLYPVLEAKTTIMDQIESDYSSSRRWDTFTEMFSSKSLLVKGSGERMNQTHEEAMRRLAITNRIDRAVYLEFIDESVSFLSTKPSGSCRVSMMPSVSEHFRFVIVVMSPPDGSSASDYIILREAVTRLTLHRMSRRDFFGGELVFVALSNDGLETPLIDFGVMIAEDLRANDEDHKWLEDKVASFLTRFE